jgi:hypothetical protein
VHGADECAPSAADHSVTNLSAHDGYVLNDCDCREETVLNITARRQPSQRPRHAESGL